mgnify:CR=1 FL=1
MTAWMHLHLQSVTMRMQFVRKGGIQEKNMDYIVTRNNKDYQAGGTKIILPDDFVKLVEEE